MQMVTAQGVHAYSHTGPSTGGDHMTKGFGHKVQQVAKGIHKIRTGRWSLVKREGNSEQIG